MGLTGADGGLHPPQTDLTVGPSHHRGPCPGDVASWICLPPDPVPLVYLGSGVGGDGCVYLGWAVGMGVIGVPTKGLVAWSLLGGSRHMCTWRLVVWGVSGASGPAAEQLLCLEVCSPCPRPVP